MKMQELNTAELKEINGGSLFGGNSDSESSNAFGGSLGIGNLLSSSKSSTNGDQSQSSSFSAGNGISLDFASIANKLSRTV